LDELEEKIDESMRRLGAIERNKIRLAGFWAGVIAVGGVVGSVLTIIGQIIVKKITG